MQIWQPASLAVAAPVRSDEHEGGLRQKRLPSRLHVVPGAEYQEDRVPCAVNRLKEMIDVFQDEDRSGRSEMHMSAIGSIAGAQII